MCEQFSQRRTCPPSAAVRQVNLPSQYRRLVDYVDKILRGAKPADCRSSSRPSLDRHGIRSSLVANMPSANLTVSTV
jgi:hypothetical protein